jgi:hypothetical protein
LLKGSPGFSFDGQVTIGRITRIPLREVWKHEALNFTRWLQQNIEVLNELLDLEITSVGREQAAGSFSVDLVGEDGQGNAVVIENQLEKSDHDHLGKLITYLSAFEAKTAIWIVAEPRPEHVAAITWLNESAPASFYLVKLEAVRIGDSLPAPLLTLIVGPSPEGREIGGTKKEYAERHMLRQRFWKALQERAASRTNLHAGVSPNYSPYFGVSAGKSGLQFVYMIGQHKSRVELVIIRGTEEESTAVFNQLKNHQEEIEKSFHDPLDWELLKGSKRSRIAKRLDSGGYRNPESEWPRIQDEMIDTMVRLESALRPYIEKIP